MRDGTYSGNFTASYDGTALNPVVISAYTGELPVIDGQFVVDGDYIRLLGIEFKRTTGWTEGREPGAGAKPTHLTVNGDGCEIVNCIMHDGSNGISWWGQGGTMYGCLLYHNGYKSDGTPQGHGAYIQNNTPRKTAKHNILVDNFGWGFHCWSNDQNKVHRITLDGNIAYNNGSLFWTFAPNFTVTNTAQAEQALTVQNNCTYQPAGETTQNAVGQSAAVDVTFTNNYTPEHTETGGVANFLANSGNYDGPDIGNQVFVIPNEYDTSRAHVAIYNQAEANTVDVDVSAVFDNDDVIDCHNAQDYSGDVQTLTVTAGVITINMQAANRTVATPYGWTAPAKSFPQFGAFVLVRQ